MVDHYNTMLTAEPLNKKQSTLHKLYLNSLQAIAQHKEQVLQKSVYEYRWKYCTDINYVSLYHHNTRCLMNVANSCKLLFNLNLHFIE